MPKGDDYKKNYGEALRAELVEMVQDHLTPVALKYHYSEVALDTHIRWRPVVLLLGNYSSGKSTLINELLGGEVQQTGQAPTDDSFTVITRAEGIAPDEGVRVTEEREGHVLINDPQYPFEVLKKYGQRFSAHLRLKKVNSSFLDGLAIIDTPGMLDSMSERDRGYDYQQVIGDLAQIADLILILFDPHKAGTVRESHESLRNTLPQATLEDRLVFVLNRIDECSNLSDLIRVFGTLCWNLSQMTGRKDIPKIMMTYSPGAAQRGEAQPFLPLLRNDRDQLRQLMLDAPKHRLDHLASYIEMHGERLSHFLEAVANYGKALRTFSLRQITYGVLLGLVGGAFFYGVHHWGWLEWGLTREVSIGVSLLLAALIAGVWAGPLRKQFVRGQRNAILRNLDQLTKLKTQARKDSWDQVKDLVQRYLDESHGQINYSQVRADLKDVQRAYSRGAKAARAALAEYHGMNAS